QQLARYNVSVLDAGQAHRSIRLFQGVRGDVTYVTELVVDQHEPYYWSRGPGRDGAERRVLMIRLRRAPVDPPPPADPRETPASPALLLPPIDVPYTPADEHISVTAALPTSSPAAVERAARAHATTQNLLAEWLFSRRLVPLSPAPDQPAFDLAWRERGDLFVAEVKSLPPDRELPQLRLGLGQVLDYAHSLGARPVLVTERRPSDPRWLDLCSSLGISLVWPSGFDRLLDHQGRQEIH
ncbi:MAG: hypothetical protein ACRYG2_14310, partial [Janthinobacterium lividum]